MHNVELHSMYSLLRVLTVMKSKRMSLAERLALMGEQADYVRVVGSGAARRKEVVRKERPGFWLT